MRKREGASSRARPAQPPRGLCGLSEHAAGLSEASDALGRVVPVLEPEDVVQLQHVRTGLFLCVQNIAADVDGEEDDEDNAPRRLHLHVGCEGCHLSVVPHGFIPRKTSLESGVVELEEMDRFTFPSSPPLLLLFHTGGLTSPW